MAEHDWVEVDRGNDKITGATGTEVSGPKPSATNCCQAEANKSQWSYHCLISTANRRIRKLPYDWYLYSKMQTTATLPASNINITRSFRDGLT